MSTPDHETEPARSNGKSEAFPPAMQGAGNARGNHAAIWLAILGLWELAICFYCAHAQNRRQITATYLASLVQAVPYLLAAWLLLKRRIGRWGFWLGLGFALAFRLVALLGTQPYLSTDVYRYVWDGRVQGAGINPYRYVSSDPALAKLRDEAVYARMNRPNVRTIYPPGAEMLFFAVTRFGDRAFVMRLAMVGFEALVVWAVCGLLRGVGLPRARVLLYAWHPLPIWEFAGSGHVDAAMIAALAVGLWAVQRGRWTGAGFALAAASLIKLFPVVLFPAFYRRWDWRLPVAVVVSVVVAYAVYLNVGPSLMFDFLLNGYSHEEGIDSGERFFLVALAKRVLHVGMSAHVFQGFAGLMLAAMGAWMLWMRSRDPMTTVRRAAALATTFTVLLSPGYAWYFAWLVLFLPFLPRLGLFWLTAASFVLYANWLHTTLDDFFVIHCVLYLPAAGLALVDFYRAQRGSQRAFLS